MSRLRLSMSMKAERVLATGGVEFPGSSVVDRLRQKGFERTSLMDGSPLDTGKPRAS